MTPTYNLTLMCAVPAGEVFKGISSLPDGTLFLITDKNVYQMNKL
jgi:hypothetical protein